MDKNTKQSLIIGIIMLIILVLFGVISYITIKNILDENVFFNNVEELIRYEKPSITGE